MTTLWTQKERMLFDECTIALGKIVGHGNSQGMSPRDIIVSLEAALEHIKMDIREAALGSCPATSEEYIRSMYTTRGKIGAIKVYRDIFNSSLVEAKLAIEQRALIGGWKLP